jgi:streptomycin 6-kinase
MEAFEQNIINLYGEKGKQWLNNLPKLIMQVEATYRLSNLKPVKNLSYNYVLSGFQGSKAIILKSGMDIDGFKWEARGVFPVCTS